jgi:hypothetical protein
VIVFSLTLVGCSDKGAWDLFGLDDREEEDLDILDSLLARYTFDNSAFPGTDDSGNGLHGTPNGATWINDPSRGGVLQFNGTTDYVALPAIAGGVTEFSITAWVNLANLSGWEPIFNVDGWLPGWLHFQIAVGGTLQAGINSNTPTNTDSLFVFGPINYGQWIHVAVVYDMLAQTTELYIDGDLDNIGILTTAVAVELEAGRIGSWDGGRWLEGLLDDVRFYRRALSDLEIATIHAITQ